MLPNGKIHSIWQCVDCDTEGVIYLMSCACNAYYVDKTKRKLKQQINYHLYDIVKGRINKPIPRHIGFCHKLDEKMIKFSVLEVIPYPIQEGNWDREILNWESKWIFLLREISQPGLNETHSYKPIFSVILIYVRKLVFFHLNYSLFYHVFYVYMCNTIRGCFFIYFSYVVYTLSDCRFFC